MKTANNSSGLTGVTVGWYKGEKKYWMCRVQRKKMNFKKRFPFTERGKMLAALTYQKKIKQLNDTSI